MAEQLKKREKKYDYIYNDLAWQLTFFPFISFNKFLKWPMLQITGSKHDA